MRIIPFYFLNITKKNLKVLKILKEEGFLRYFLFSGRKIKIFPKQDLTKSIRYILPIKVQKYSTKLVSNSEIWKYNLKPGVFLLNTTFGFFSERLLKRKFKGGRILTCTK